MATEPVDYLKSDADQLHIPGQKYAIISVVSPQSAQKHDTCAVKIRGVFGSLEEAQMQAKIVNKSDPLFDVFLVELYKWLPVPPSVDMIKDQQYQDNVLNNIIRSHADEQLKAREFFEKRKIDLMQGVGDPLDGLGVEYPAPEGEGSSSKGKEPAE